MEHWTSNIIKIQERSRATRALHVCCGKNKYPGAIGIDNNRDSHADVFADLNVFPWPFADNEFDTVVCINALEHLPDTVGVMKEIYRVSKPAAILYILTPHFSDAGSFIDPTHIHHFSARSFDYFIEGTSLSEEYGFYAKCRFHLLKRQLMLHRFFKLLEVFFNRHIALYEEVFCYIFRAEGIYMELEVKK